jgi:hypothetical protein
MAAAKRSASPRLAVVGPPPPREGGGAARPLPSVALHLDALDREPWERLVRDLAALERGSSWWLGDALAYGEDLLGVAHGEMAELTGFSVGHLKSVKWLSKAVRPDERRPELAWSAHRPVGKLPAPQQRTWLAAAVAGGWGEADLKQEMEQARAVGVDAPLPVVEFTATTPTSTSSTTPPGRKARTKAAPPSAAAPASPVFLAPAAEDDYQCPACSHEWSGDPRPSARMATREAA